MEMDMVVRVCAFCRKEWVRELQPEENYPLDSIFEECVQCKDNPYWWDNTHLELLEEIEDSKHQEPNAGESAWYDSLSLKKGFRP